MKLAKSNENEVDEFVLMESSPDASKYVTSYSREKHLSEMMSENVTYLSIYDNDELCGFVILAIEASGIELRRIVVSSKGKGLGQKAMRGIDEYCSQKMGASRIWLDVFEDNMRGIHIYKKCGYQQFNTLDLDGRLLLLFEKTL
ncbi:GNAT family N-acetyltransferase [Enterovibrio sp. ZSDZ35]|uniref:GNAT family N-acetyltransferase n=1 Tax=Enterovibrio qingdaonensis TaxID=2899818 RepID=A0ABT5QHG1_9GAMM|nr:GNAT family N-acetyltransferase [Enterovibrio sp. ZSDZ35]MDD1780422.1 GNAT family N-acetyltransferase [Enterovibrio sp. ZSDZ35]